MSQLIENARLVVTSTNKIASPVLGNICRGDDMFKWFESQARFIELVEDMVINGWKKDESIYLAPFEAGSYDQSAEKDIRIAFYENYELPKSFKVPVTDEKGNQKYGPNKHGERSPIYQDIVITNAEVVDEYKRDQKNVKHTHVQLTGFRRMTVRTVANCIRRKLGRDIIKDIPTLVLERMPNDFEYKAINYAENTAKQVGVQAISDAQLLLNLHKDISTGDNFPTDSTEGRITGITRWTRGSKSQKFAYLCNLIDEFPEVDLKRVILENSKVFSKYDKTKIQRMYSAPNDKDLAAVWERADIDYVLAYLAEPAKYNGKGKKALTTAQIKGCAKKTSVLIIREALNTIVDGDSLTDYLAQYYDYASLINGAVSAIAKPRHEMSDLEKQLIDLLEQVLDENNNIKLSKTDD